MCKHINLYILMRDAEGRKKETSKVIQTTKQSNTAHPRQSFFQRKMSCLGWDSNPRHSTHVHMLPTVYTYIGVEEMQQSLVSEDVERVPRLLVNDGQSVDLALH